MQARDLKVTDGVAAGAWIRPRLGSEISRVADQVPKGYEAYVRIFHPAGHPGGKPIRWAQVADAMGKTAHREMQWESLIAGSSEWDGQAPSEVDFDSTLVGGSAELIKAIVESPALEAWQIEPTDSLAFDADKVNGTPGAC